ncbi:hypothetical protein GZH53_16820 [Flavihumibacter sp. R14]|nr:hypothetical protein [Flavihumibacter soli]
MEKISLVKWGNTCKHVSQETIIDFEEVLQSSSFIKTVYNKPTFGKKFVNKFLKIFFLKVGLNSNIALHKKSESSLAILMGEEFEKCLINFLLSRENAAYFFDAWPAHHFKILKFLESFNVKYVFFSSKRAAETFQLKSSKFKAFWIPEAINISKYRFDGFNRKSIDVLQFGRKYDLYHDKISLPLKERGVNYLYEQTKGRVIFNSQEDFLDGLAKTKISICFPSSLTHPARSGEISTMTVRYLQSMASKCLVVGTMPEDMIELFNYTPIIEVNFEDPVGQLLSILNSYDDYVPLIEKNYITVKNCHTWAHRSDTIIQILSKSIN